MATYSKETALYDTGAIAGDIQGVRTDFAIADSEIRQQLVDDKDELLGEIALKVDSETLATSVNAVADQIRLSADNIFLGEKSVEDSMGELTSTIAIDTNPANPSVRIGSTDGFNIKINNEMLGFYYGTDPNPVAYIKNDQLYISRSVVLKQMDVGRLFGEIDPSTQEQVGFGQWSWKVHKNADGKNNLNLKWVG